MTPDPDALRRLVETWTELAAMDEKEAQDQKDRPSALTSYLTAKARARTFRLCISGLDSLLLGEAAAPSPQEARPTVRLDSYYDWCIEKMRQTLREAQGTGSELSILMAAFDSILKQVDVHVIEFGDCHYKELSKALRAAAQPSAVPAAREAGHAPETEVDRFRAKHPGVLRLAEITEWAETTDSRLDERDLRADVLFLLSELGRAEPPADLLANQVAEICICAAIQLSGGELFRGHRHDDAIQTAGKAGVERGSIADAEQGFITSRNRFVGREEGARLQRAAGIPSATTGELPSDGMLFSEDLYLRTTKGQILPRVTGAFSRDSVETNAAERMVDQVVHRPDGQRESAARTLASIAAMLGWLNMPPRDVLEADVRALKARVKENHKLQEIRSQMLAVLVRDLGHDHQPQYGWAPVRHQYAWRMAVDGMTDAEIAAEVTEGKARSEGDGEPFVDYLTRRRERTDLQATTSTLRTALEQLRIDANRLCDRMLGGTYEDDCRRSIAAADAALADAGRE